MNWFMWIQVTNGSVKEPTNSITDDEDDLGEFLSARSAL